MNLSKKLVAIFLAMLLFVACTVPGAFAANTDTGITVSADKNAKKISVQIDIPSAAGKEASFICMDPSFIANPAGGSYDDWVDHPESVCYLDQVTLDAAGKASITFTVDEPVAGDYNVLVGASNATYTDKVAFEASKGELPVVSDKASYKVNEEVILTVTTPLNASRIALYNENDMHIGSTVKSVVINPDSKVWTISTKIGTKGDARTVTAYAYDKSKAVIDYGKVTFAVVPLDAALTSAVCKVASAKVNATFEIELITSAGVKKIAFANNSGMNIGKTLVSKKVVGNSITWIYSMKLGSAGAGRQINVNLTDVNGVLFNSVGSFTIDIVK